MIKLGPNLAGRLYRGSLKIGNPSQTLYVLKQLIKQYDLERRERMYREITTLKTIRHTSIPLYAVFEYI